MNPLTLHLRNYRCFSELDLQLPNGCVAILGGNGAGKSSIVNAIDLTIFGARSLAEYLSDQADGEELLLELDLEHAGGIYRIRRTYSPRGRGRATLDFEKRTDPDDGESWLPLTRASAKETQELIEATFGLSRETFRASAFLAQGDGAAFTNAQPRDRKRILAQVLGLDRYDHLQERARQDRRTIEAEQHTLDGRSQAARDLVEQKPQVVRDRDAVVEAETLLAGQAADLEREHAGLVDRYQQAREQAARRQAREAELATARAELTRLDEIERSGSAAAVLISEARDELQALPEPAALDELRAREADLVRQVDAHTVAVHHARQCETEAASATRRRGELTTQRTAAKARADALTAQISHLERGALDNCPTCKQALGADARAETIATLTAQAVAAIDESSRLLQEADAVVVPDIPVVPPAPEGLADLREQITLAQSQETKRATFEERIRQAQSVIDSQPANLTALKDAAAAAVEAKSRALDLLQPVDLDEITRAGQLVKSRLETARRDLEQQRTLKARLEERLSQIEAAEAELAAATTESHRLHASLDIAVMLERAFGPDGVPALIIENAAIPYLESEANRILGAIANEALEGARIELRTQAELKSGAGLRDTLDIAAITASGHPRLYENWSGGEKTRIDLAIRIALARLLAHRRGAESRLLAIDEPNGLDDDGIAAVLEVLRGLQGDFDKLYIVSHVPGLRDSFDTTLSVVCDGDGWSRIDEAETFEAVVA